MATIAATVHISERGYGTKFSQSNYYLNNRQTTTHQTEFDGVEHMRHLEQEVQHVVHVQ
ncbi:hypothetical protein [Vibrio gallaecicus]|uniref:hypothetical protein n=1 Tax=Vibrio gallaecicus TaxID=552386 RepID=UPI0025B4E654|nr:hypothetical protein [Vibrio gallaecicus]MDN3613187.1 hypothetical protein [Vibrio gallaecicus]